MQHTYIKELLHRRFLSVESNVALKDVITLMHQQSSACIVVTERDKPVGIVTERDVVALAAELMEMYPSRPTLVVDCMSSPTVCISQDSTLYEALVITQTREIRYLPVVDKQGRLLGLLSDNDIARAHLRVIEGYRTDVEGDIQQRTRDLERNNSVLQALSLYDVHLGIGNRRAMEVDMQFTHLNACQYGRGYSVVLLDVDDYESYERNYGEAASGMLLKQFSVCITEVVRSVDRLYRYGPSQFLLLLCETPMAQGLVLTERLLDLLEGLHIPHLQNEYGVATVSAGVSELVTTCHLSPDTLASRLGRTPAKPVGEWQAVVADAQHWLARAQSQGGNCLCCAQQDVSASASPFQSGHLTG